MTRQKILVIEDEEDILSLLHYNLGKEGYSVSTASSGELGLELARKGHPDLVVLDLMLPGIDGLDVARSLKNNKGTENIPIIMLTAKGEETDIVTGLELGADDYITKPFSIKELKAKVKSLSDNLHLLTGILLANLKSDEPIESAGGSFQTFVS